MSNKENYYTYKEIRQQPDTWVKEYDNILSSKDSICAFLSRYAGNGYEVIFTGAGTSAYIGDMLAFLFHDLKFSSYRAVPTTDIVTHCASFLYPGKKVLLVSFARSGNSPESVAAVNLVNKSGAEVAHIFITCNAEGHLAKIASGSDNTLLLLLPPETDDVSLAMTSSFSTMAMACLMAFNAGGIEAHKEYVANAAGTLRAAMEKYEAAIEAVAAKDFHRAVFLGSGALKGIAEESHLKLQELTDGAVMCTFDSFLGFRHGPKAVVKNDALLVYLLSDDLHVRKYEIDLIRQINAGNKVAAQILVASEPVKIEGIDFDAEIIINPDSLPTGDYGNVSYVFVAQMLGCFKSIAYGLSPDAPSKSGNIHRVVEGVTIYDI